FDAARQNALVEKMKRVLLAEADRAQELVRLARDRLGRPARIGLGHGDVGRARQSLLLAPGRAVDKTARRLDIAEEVGTGVLDSLERAERPAELPAALGVLHAQLENALRSADYRGGTGEGAGLERAFERLPSVTRLSEKIAGLHLYAVEAHLARAVSGQRLHGQHRDAGSPRVEQEKIHSHGAAGGDDEIVGDVRVVHEELPARESASGLTLETHSLRFDRRALLREGQHAEPVSARH